MTKPKWADLFGIDPTYTDDPTYADEVKRLRDDADVRERAMMRRISELEATIEQVRDLHRPTDTNHACHAGCHGSWPCPTAALVGGTQ